jgi:Ras-related protein Rab-11A
VLAGEMGSGKTNILQRYHKNVFTRVQSTIGSEFLTKRIILGDLPDQPAIKAQIWDTSGSERYRSITTGHYRSAVGALLVMDITERESFDQLDYWLE